MIEKKLNAWLTQIPDSETFIKTSFDKNSSTSCVKEMFALGSDIGSKRIENQDRVAAIWVNAGALSERHFFTCVLCDGMGGMKDGTGSAATAISSFLSNMVLGRKLDTVACLENAALAANKAVDEKNGGGSTLSAITISNGRVYSLNVGDSRIYSVSTIAGVKRHTQDDNLKEAFGGNDEGLLQYIGMGEGIRPHIKEIELDFDFLFLTSDGVHNLEPPVFDKIILNSQSPSEICGRLIKTAVWAGGQDNASVVAISKSMLSPHMLSQKEAEIAVWSQKGELQVIWADGPQVLSKQQLDLSDLYSNPDRGTVEDRNSTQKNRYVLNESSRNRTRKNKAHKKSHSKAKEGFGDLERDQNEN